MDPIKTGSLTLRKAAREKTKMRVALAGPSGSGKTYSALLLASGMAPWDKIALIDTENGSGDLYAHLGAYSVVTLGAPFTPERYVDAIDACEKAGMEVIILDSISHEWEGKGGILDIKDAMTGNIFTNWGKITPRHNAFIDRMLRSPCHVVATMRAKQEYVLTEKNGRQVPEKVGMKAVTRDGVDYEFTLVFDLNINHLATATKDRTGIFMAAGHDTVLPEKISPETGRKLLAWTGQGVEQPKPEPPPLEKPEKPPYTKVLEALTACTDLKPLELIYERACTFQWDMKDAEGITACYETMKERLTPKAEKPREVIEEEEKAMADAEMKGRALADSQAAA